MTDFVPTDDFYTPANPQTVEFRLNLIKQYPTYLNAKQQSTNILEGKTKFQLTSRSSFTANGAIAKIINYKNDELLMSTHRGDILSYNIDTIEHKILYNHNNMRVSAISYNPFYDLIVSGAQDGTLLFNRSGQSSQLPAHKDRIVDTQLLNHSPNNLLAISQDKTWSLHDLSKSALLYKQDGYTSGLSSMALSPFDNLFVTATVDEIQFHDLRSGSLLGRSRNIDREPCHAMKVLENGHTLITGGQGKLKVFDLRKMDVSGMNESLITEKLVHQGNLVTSMSLEEGMLVSTGFKDGSVEINSLRNGIVENINENRDTMNIVGDKLLTCKILKNGTILSAGFNAKLNFI